MSMLLLVVDDSSVAIKGAIETLGSLRETMHVQAYPDIGKVLTLARDQQTERNIVLLDPFPVDECDVDLVQFLCGATRVLAMSRSSAIADVRLAISLGVRGYIGKDATTKTLIAAVQAIDVDGFYLPAELSRAAMPESDLSHPMQAIGSLTGRENHVLSMVAQGLTYKQIGSRLRLSKATVDTYVQRIRQKLGAGNKAELTRIAIELGLLLSSAPDATAQVNDHGAWASETPRPVVLPLRSTPSPSERIS
jgi:two-component system nitrate/nitrite response regulator NarL